MAQTNRPPHWENTCQYNLSVFGYERKRNNIVPLRKATDSIVLIRRWNCRDLKRLSESSTFLCEGPLKSLTTQTTRNPENHSLSVKQHHDSETGSVLKRYSVPSHETSCKRRQHPDRTAVSILPPDHPCQMREPCEC